MRKKTKSDRISIRVNPQDKKALVAAAQKCGQDLTEYLMIRGLAGTPRERTHV